MRANWVVRSGAATGMLAIVGFAQADVIYQNAFESGPLGPEWTSTGRLDSHANFSRFNGRYTNEAITLTLGAVPPPGGVSGWTVGKLGKAGKVGGVPFGGGGGGGDGDGGDGGGGGDGGDGGEGDGGDGGSTPYILYTVEFDLYTLDSWDGSDTEWGPDTFEVRANGSTLLHESFSTGTYPQSFRAPDIGPAEMGYSSRWNDAIYRDISLSFEAPPEAERIHITFQGIGLQSVYDESWGIDNVTVSYEVKFRSVPAPATIAAGAGLLLLGGRRRRS